MMEVPLKSVCTIMMGQAPPGTTYNQKGLGLPLIAGAGDFGELNPEPTKFTTEPTKIAKSGDLILCIRATIGDRNWADRQYCLGRGVAGLSPKPNQLDARYLWHWLEIGKNQLINQARGSTFKQVSQDVISSCQIPLPPLEEQRRIAAILDKADAVRRKRQQAIALTEELLRSAFLEMFGDPVTNPKGWEVKLLNEVLEVLHRYPTFYGCEYVKTGVPVLKIGSIGKDYIVDRDLSLYDKVTPAFSAHPKTVVKQNDLVMAVRGDTTGKIGLIPSELVGANISPNLIRLSPQRNLCVPQYLFWVFRCGQGLIESRINDTAKKSLTAATLRDVPIPIPPKLKQDEFERIFERVISMKNKQQRGWEKKEIFFNSLLQRAFCGEL